MKTKQDDLKTIDIEHFQKAQQLYKKQLNSFFVVEYLFETIQDQVQTLKEIQNTLIKNPKNKELQEAAKYYKKNIQYKRKSLILKSSILSSELEKSKKLISEISYFSVGFEPRNTLFDSVDYLDLQLEVMEFKIDQYASILR